MMKRIEPPPSSPRHTRARRAKGAAQTPGRKRPDIRAWLSRHLPRRAKATPAKAPAKTPGAPRKISPRLSQTAVALCLAALSAVYTAGLSENAATVVAHKRVLPVYSVERADKVISVSFDAAWGGAQTEGILDILDQYGVKTTFFLVDIWTQRFPELAKEIVARGHELGNHSTTHAHMTKLTDDQIRQELRVMSDNAEKLTGMRPTLFRPPYGDYNDKVVTLARAEGYEAVQWSIDSLDWKNRGVQDMITQSTKRFGPGDIVLFHNDSQYILEALPTILKTYQEQGYKIVPVSEILLQGETTIDTQGRQHPAASPAPEV